MSEANFRKRKACIECAKAKRKCDRRRPHCKRCSEKELDCRYLITVPALVYDESVEDPAEETEDVPAPEDTPETSSPVVLHHAYSTGEGNTSRDTWLLSPPFWHIENTVRRGPSEPFNEQGLHLFIRSIQSWIKQWVTQGSSPIIHSQLYPYNRLPDVIRDAYTSVTAYMACNDANRLMTLRIIEDRCNLLIQAHAGYSEDALGAAMLDTSSQLARTQALMIYHVIQLFDGDIRSRAQAESHISILNAWASQMWEAACLDVNSASVRLSETEPQYGAVPFVQVNVFTSGSLSSSYWRAWIVGESVRRAYLAANYTSAVYLSLKNGMPICPGGAVFTGRSGMWDATSPYMWLKARQGPTMVFMSMCRADKILEGTLPGDVDEFTYAVLAMSFSPERVCQWLGGKYETALIEGRMS